MNLESPPIFLLSFISLLLLPSLISSQSCRKSCGDQLVRYPFGTGPGCGNPRFQKYVTCNQQELTFTTHTGCYTIQSIDYNNQVIYIQDRSMSTCSYTQPSQGFGLDWDAPFSFLENNVFALLDCSTTSSPLYTSQTTDNNTMAPLCDNEGAPVCSILYSCPLISALNHPTSTCCVYTPIDLGPAFAMDLQRLQCSSYTSVYSFNGQESNPGNWKYGIALKYRFNVKNDYPSDCSICEKTNGACGYTGIYSSFTCNCVGGFNTTMGCYSIVSDDVKLLPQYIGSWVILCLMWFLT